MNTLYYIFLLFFFLSNFFSFENVSTWKLCEYYWNTSWNYSTKYVWSFTYKCVHCLSNKLLKLEAILGIFADCTMQVTLTVVQPLTSLLGYDAACFPPCPGQHSQCPDMNPPPSSKQHLGPSEGFLQRSLKLRCPWTDQEAHPYSWRLLPESFPL